MTVCFPPLIKPDRRFSRIRLSEFLGRKADALGPSVICSCRTLLGACSPCGPSPRPSLLFTSAEQVASLRSSASFPNQRSGAGSSLLRTPPTPALARTASPFKGVAPPVESLLAMTGLPAFPNVTSQHVAHADPAGPLSGPRRLVWVGLCGLHLNWRGSAAGSTFSRLIYVVHMFIATCRFDSMPAPHPASRRRSWHGLRC
jgi:hypothetical protein